MSILVERITLSTALGGRTSVWKIVVGFNPPIGVLRERELFGAGIVIEISFGAQCCEFFFIKVAEFIGMENH